MSARSDSCVSAIASLPLYDRERVVLVDAGLAAVGIHGDRGDEEVMPDVAGQHLAGIAHPERQAGGVVDAHVPLATGQRLQVTRIAIAEQLLHLARPFRRRPLAAIEQRHLVPARQRVVHLERTGEAGAAEDEDVERLGGALHGLGVLRERQRRHPGSGGERAELEQVTAGGHRVAPGGRVCRRMPCPLAGFPRLRTGQSYRSRWRGVNGALVTDARQAPIRRAWHEAHRTVVPSREERRDVIAPCAPCARAIPSG